METPPVIFRLPGLENEYRQHFLKMDAAQSAMGILLWVVPTVVFSYSDYLFFGFGKRFYELTFARGAWVIFSLVLAYVLSKRVSRFERHDWLVLLWNLMGAVFQLSIDMTRPPTYIQHSVIDIMIMLSVYLIMPNRLIFRIVPAFLFTIGSILMFLFVKASVAPLAFHVTWVSFALANVLGIIFSVRLYSFRRQQFKARLEAEAAREELRQERNTLQQALSEVKTLSGLLPICASCKRIRDDQGYWNQIEAYIRDHSQAEFSHGLCPECAKKLYPEYFGDESG